MSYGPIYTVAGSHSTLFAGDGGPAVSAGLETPQAVAVSSTGNLLITDTYHNRIRQVAG